MLIQHKNVLFLTMNNIKNTANNFILAFCKIADLDMAIMNFLRNYERF